jgi:hypothetical protein
MMTSKIKTYCIQLVIIVYKIVSSVSVEQSVNLTLENNISPFIWEDSSNISKIIIVPQTYFTNDIFNI